MNKIFFIDLDDTLIHTYCHYERAKKDFFNFMQNKFDNLKYSFDDVINMQIKNQLMLIDKFGFDTEVFPRSLKNVYLEIAKENEINNIKITNEANQVYKIGKSVFSEYSWKKAGLYPYVKDTLEFLVNEGDNLEMITLGDFVMQKRKVRVMELNKWFPAYNVHVVLKEKASKIKELSFEKDKNNIYFVGDSYNNDIFPALEAGINAIYIPQKAWLLDGANKEFHSKMIQLTRFSDIKKIYNFLPN